MYRSRGVRARNRIESCDHNLALLAPKISDPKLLDQAMEMELIYKLTKLHKHRFISSHLSRLC